MAANNSDKTPKHKVINVQVKVPNIPKPSMPHPTKRQRRVFAGIGVGLAVILLGFGGGYLGAKVATQDNSSAIVQQRTVLTNEADLVSSIASDVGDSVVSVNVTSETPAANYGFFWYGYGGGTQTQQSAGTGIILTDDGLIMTNRHVVPAGTTDVSITLSDGTVLDNVEIIGRTADSDSLDIAFLQVKDTEGHALTPAKLGDSSAMEVGDSVIAIGNALGQFQNTVTTGIISGYGRSIQAGDGTSASTETLDDMFQTDAAINEGNSGGPLVNLNGEVIGINTAIASGSQNIGFAIPVNDIRGLIKSVKETGELQRPHLGIHYVMLTDDIAEQYDLSVSRGAYIPTADQLGTDSVISGGPADKAGIKPGDIITKIGGTTIDEKHSLLSLLGQYTVGDSVKLTIQRGDTSQVISVTLAQAPTN